MRSGGSTHSTATTKRRVTFCRECLGRIETNALGRPRITCGFDCARARKLCRLRDLYAYESAGAREWWLSLTANQRTTAVAWTRANPVPSWFSGGRQMWAACNRAEFSCEGRPTSIA